MQCFVSHYSLLGLIQFHCHYHFDNGYTISYNKSTTLYYNWIVSHYLNDYDLFFKVQLFKVCFLYDLIFVCFLLEKLIKAYKLVWIAFLNQSAIYIIISSLLFQEEISVIRYIYNIAKPILSQALFKYFLNYFSRRK